MLNDNGKFSHKNTQSKSSLSYLSKLRKTYGFTGLLNTHIMIIISTKDLTPLDRNVLLYVIKNTIGWNSLEMYFDIETISSDLCANKDRVRNSLKRLEEYEIIERSKKQKHTKSKGILRLQPEHTFWKIEYNKALVDSVIPKKQRTRDTQNTNNVDDTQNVMELMKDFD